MKHSQNKHPEIPQEASPQEMSGKPRTGLIRRLLGKTVVGNAIASPPTPALTHDMIAQSPGVARQKAIETAALAQLQAQQQSEERIQSAYAREYNGEVQHNVSVQGRIVTGFANRNVYVLSAEIPPRHKSRGRSPFSGDYAQLAGTALAKAQQNQRPDGTFELIGDATRAQLLPEFTPDTRIESIYENGRTAESHNRGVATLLWQADFINFESEHDREAGTGEMNPDIQWASSPDGRIAYASIKHDPTNDFHQMIAPGAEADARIRLEMPNPLTITNGQILPFMGIRGVDGSGMDTMPLPVVA